MADWHPLLAAREVTPGRWFLIDGLDKPYGEVRLVRRGGQVGYRAERCDERAQHPRLVGYYRTLRGACVAVHRVFVTEHGPPPAPDEMWSTHTGMPTTMPRPDPD